MSTKYSCSTCKQAFPETPSHLCPHCGGVFEIQGLIDFDPKDYRPDAPGIWRYENSFGLPSGARRLSLGEGNTPLMKVESFGKELYLKNEFQNPTGSFKDRLSCVEISYLEALGAKYIVDDSSGNAGASFAAYAQLTALDSTVYVPTNASGPKLKQIKAYGSEVVQIAGPRSQTSKAVLEAVEAGACYASHAYLPFGVSGLATIAYELMEQLGGAPGTVICPVGQGSLLMGLVKGFEALMAKRLIDSFPNILGVQAKAFSPFCAKPDENYYAKAEFSVAEGIQVHAPIHKSTILAYAQQWPIQFHCVHEHKILPGRDQLARLGFYVEPTSAVVWDAWQQYYPILKAPVIAILTGSGLKH